MRVVQIHGQVQHSTITCESFKSTGRFNTPPSAKSKSSIACESFKSTGRFNTPPSPSGILAWDITSFPALLRCWTVGATGEPESDTKTSPSLAALDKVFFALLVSNLGVIKGVFACLGGRCLGVTRAVLGPFLEDFTAGPLFSFLGSSGQSLLRFACVKL